MAAAAVSAPPSAASSRLLITPYTPPRDVLAWNRREKSWLRVEFGSQLEPTAEWLRSAIERQLGGSNRVTHLFVGKDNKRLSPEDLQRPLDYFTFGELQEPWTQASCQEDCCAHLSTDAALPSDCPAALRSQTAFCRSRAVLPIAQA